MHRELDDNRYAVVFVAELNDASRSALVHVLQRNGQAAHIGAGRRSVPAPGFRPPTR
jgi:hypothetical protein